MKAFTKADLEAARRRLDAAQGITDEIVEIAARATWEQAQFENAARFGRKAKASFVDWLKAPQSEKDIYLRRARVTLRAALPLAATHLCDTCAQSMCRRRRDVEDACEDPIFPGRAVIVECKAYVAHSKVQEVLERARETAAPEGR